MVKYIKSILADFTFIGITYLLFQWFSALIETRGMALTQGLPLEELQNVLTSDLAKTQAYAADLQSFVLTFIIGFCLIFIFTTLFYSLTRAYLWNELQNKTFSKRKYWKWPGMTLVVAIITCIEAFIFLIIKSILTPLKTTTTSAFIVDIILFLVILLYIFFVFILFKTKKKKYKVWESIGETFTIIKKKYKSIGKIYLIASGVIVVLGLLLSLLTKTIYDETTLLLINLAVFFLYIALLRVYLIEKID